MAKKRTSEQEVLKEEMPQAAPKKERKKRKNDITCVIYVNGERVDTLTQEQREIVGKRFGEALSRYYTNHMDEYVKLPAEIF